LYYWLNFYCNIASKEQPHWILNFLYSKILIFFVIARQNPSIHLCYFIFEWGFIFVTLLRLCYRTVFRNCRDSSRHGDLRAFLPGLEVPSKLKIHRKFVIIDWIKLFLSGYFRLNISLTCISIVFQWKNML